MNEFQLIDWIAGQAGQDLEGVRLGIGDDAAVLELPAGEHLVASTDTLVEGVHFNADDPPDSVGHKALAVNLSDLAAMGAEPRWALLSLTLPRDGSRWARGFVSGFSELARDMRVSLVGGDTTSGPRCVSVTVLGSTRRGQCLGRGGARPDDLVVVSGQLGDAALALDALRNGKSPDPGGLRKLRTPIPRIELGATLVGKATACIDISDGLLADLAHVARMSGLGARIDATYLPASDAMARCADEQRWRFQLTGGDDYELCFTWPPAKRAELDSLSRELGLDLSVVGKMVEGQGVVCFRPNGTKLEYDEQGYRHMI